MIKYSYILQVLLLALLAFVFGCGPKPGVKPMDPGVDKPIEQKEAALVSILTAEAQKFADQKQYKKALLAYNKALDHTDPKSRIQVVHDLELVLMQTPPELLDEFIKMDNSNLPKSILLYWTGVNYAAQRVYGPAINALTRFVSEYPEHPYIEDARDLLDSISLQTFNPKAIGCLLPLSGKYKVFGQRALRGIQMAVQDLSADEDASYRVIVKDTGSDPEQAVRCVEELAKENIMGIAGPLLVPEAAGKRAQELKIPMIALTQKSEFPAQGEYLFSNFITPEMQVQALGSYIFMELGLKKVAILYPEERYGKRYMELFWDVVDEFNGEVVGVESYDGKNTDFSTPLQKLTGEYYPLPEFLKPENLVPVDDPDALETGEEGGDREKPQLSSRGSAVANEDRIEIDFQALFIPDSLSRVNLILPQLAFYDARGMVLLGTNLWHRESLITQAKGYNKKAVIADGYFGKSENPITSGFHMRFTELFDHSPSFLEAIAYDTAGILFTAGAAQGVDSRESLKDQLQGGQFYEGVTGRTIFDKTGNPHKELFLITVKRGKFMEIRQ